MFAVYENERYIWEIYTNKDREREKEKKCEKETLRYNFSGVENRIKKIKYKGEMKGEKCDRKWPVQIKRKSIEEKEDKREYKIQQERRKMESK